MQDLLNKDEQKNKETEQPLINGYAALGAGQELVPHQYPAKALGPMEVEVAITHCGMCHTDLHLINDDAGISAYPLVPGHEIVGKVSKLGSQVKELAVGQRVGIGWLAGADFSCEQCLSGKDNLCASAQPTCLGQEGGYAKYVYSDARMAFPIPDNLPSEYAAPLLCAGITVFAPLWRHHVAGNTTLGIVGVGGLGHLALQYGHALGCEVIAFSSSASKEAEARKFGADQFVDTSRPGAMQAYANSCEFILNTVSADLPWADYINALKPDGKLCVLGVPESEIQVSALSLIMTQKSLVSSIIGSRSEMIAMLEFSARHQILPQIELFPLSEVNTALKKLSENKLRYRAVLTME